jgi:cell division protein FtsQ
MELSLPFPRRVPRARTRRGKLTDTRVRHTLERLRSHRLTLHVVLCSLLALPLLGGGWLWLRDSSLVSVRHVHITGVHGVDAVEIRAALDDAATRMTTIDFDPAALRAAVSTFAIVGTLHVSTSFPHTVSISVSERPPVAALLSAGQRTAVAADGTVLGPALLSSSLPTVAGSVEPSVGVRLREPTALAAVTLLGAAPAALARMVTRAYSGPEGLTLEMRSGLLVYFGNATRPHAKWMSLARVLASPSAAGALYVDVRLPERPAAGFSSTSPSPSPSPSSTSTSGLSSTLGSGSATTEAGASDPTAAALAERLATAAGGSTSTAGSSTSGTSAAEESEASTGATAASGTSETETSSPSSSSAGSSESVASEASSTPASPAASSQSGAAVAPAAATSEQSSGSAAGG